MSRFSQQAGPAAIACQQPCLPIQIDDVGHAPLGRRDRSSLPGVQAIGGAGVVQFIVGQDPDLSAGVPGTF